MRKVIVFLISLFLIPNAAIADLTVYFLDVGQGDCAFIECDGEAMVIDGGLPGQSSKVFSFIENTLPTDRFVYMVATHPDNDHIGGLPAVFEALKKNGKKLKYVYYPVKEFNSKRFNDLKSRAEEMKAKLQVPYDEQTEYLGAAKIVFYNCKGGKKSFISSALDTFPFFWRRNDEPEENKENNDMSLVVKIIYEETSILFTGDIEKEAEERLISSGIDLKADVVKIAHHGSSSSNSYDFLAKVNPDFAIISCGKGNRYGHPQQETLDALKQQNVELYRTDLQGTIICKSDGHSISCEMEKEDNSDVFVAPEKQ